LGASLVITGNSLAVVWRAHDSFTVRPPSDYSS
jgi:hypothetical protein